MMEARIVEEQSHIATFLTAIESADKAAGAKLGPQLERAKMWTLRAPDVQSQARTMACGDRKGEWRIDPAKANCDSCLKLNGKVKRFSFWRRVGVLPQNPPNAMLICGGFKCGCGIFPTNKPLSKGPLPSLP